MGLGRRFERHVQEGITVVAVMVTPQLMATPQQQKADAFKARMAKARLRPKRTPEERAANGLKKHIQHCVVESIQARSGRPGDTRTNVLLKCGVQRVECVLEQGKQPKCKKVKDARNPKVQPA